TPQALELKDTLHNRNLNALYNYETMAILGEKLLASEGTLWDFYSKSSVEELIQASIMKL
ncbi:hypothetical protein QUF58_07390, partial [Anaerolineales bacterium HSG24]|nr:hypothetical protein [Anaerolineales bacterium HSG24]